jgi:hypothetical protein
MDAMAEMIVYLANELFKLIDFLRSDTIGPYADMNPIMRRVGAHYFVLAVRLPSKYLKYYACLVLNVVDILLGEKLRQMKERHFFLLSQNRNRPSFKHYSLIAQEFWG